MEYLGLLAFGLIKYIGYYLYLKYVCPKPFVSNVYMIAFARLVIGLVVGMLIYAAFNTGRNILPVYLSAILFGRLIIWYAIFSLFYKTTPMEKKVKLTIGGTVVSYILDIPSVMGLWVIVGGIC